jgi:ribosomal protein S12 methylthiotransferase
MIVGYPTETDAEFDELMEFVREFEFDALGAFAYSPEPGTLAAKEPNQVAEEVKQDRLHRIMSLQRHIARKKSEARIGTTFEVRIEPEKRNGQLVTRHSGQAPEVDPVTLVKVPHRSPLSTLPGDKLTVKCTGVRGYDLLAEPVSDASASAGRRRK